MIFVSERELKIITDILKKHVTDGEVRVFGSRYRGDNRIYSDLDIAIKLGHKLTLSELSDIREDFEVSDLPFRVDVLDYNSLSPEFQEIIDSGYAVLSL